MAIKHEVAPFSEQDKLKEGLLKTQEQCYVPIESYGKNIDSSWERFSKLSKQDKLDEGLIKIKRINEYVSIDKLGEIENEDCFVATLVYGDINAPQVRTLRGLRDEVLMQHPSGRVLVNFYYSGAGKQAAKFIQERLPSSIPIIRRGLDFLVERYSS